VATTSLHSADAKTPSDSNGWRSISGVLDDRQDLRERRDPTNSRDRKDQPTVVPPSPSGVPRNTAWIRHRRVSTWHRPYAASLVVLDLLAALAASVTALYLVPQATAAFKDNHLLQLLAYAFLPVGWLVALWGHGGYDRRYLGIGTDEFKRVARASVTVMATVSFLAFAFQKGGNLSRVSVAVALVAGLVYVLLLRFAARRVLHLVRGRGGASHRLLLVGTLSESLEVYKAVTRTRHAGMVPIAIHLNDGRQTQSRRSTPVPVFAGRDIVSLVHEINADTVAVCGSASGDRADLRRLAWQLEGTGVDLVVAPQLTDIAGPRVHIRPVEGLPLLYVEEPKLAGLSWLVKNVMDRALAATGLLVLSPLFLLVAVSITLSDRGPVFFRQRRAGREGKIFSVWKFRTMYCDAEERLAALVDQNEGDGMLFKIRNDPRVFRVGRWLRASSLDELPQLINVFRGDMSLVGPRPLPAEDGDFLGDVRRRLLVRPGMTGLWQVSGRSDLSWDDAVRLDLYYVDNWSLAFDLTILWRTVGVVLGSKGAY
jgi:exopolysaccharide biosynthesis polyprenyl glycosylphosphotransferase